VVCISASSQVKTNPVCIVTKKRAKPKLPALPLATHDLRRRRNQVPQYFQGDSEGDELESEDDLGSVYGDRSNTLRSNQQEVDDTEHPQKTNQNLSGLHDIIS
jgi:hypothetical protein